MAGLRLDDPTYRPPANEPLTALRPNLLEALEQQAPFEQEGSILDPALISDIAPIANPQSLEASPLDPLSPVEELRRYNDTPPGVVNPLPETPVTPSPELTTPPTAIQPPTGDAPASP
ncbi:hypothetical protein C8B47_23835 [filamentous cyanobacterium CCP4]|nr:hypothetical protein C8B47_23835 [filamentous cyanobacterium CCP4]